MNRVPILLVSLITSIYNFKDHEWLADFSLEHLYTHIHVG